MTWHKMQKPPAEIIRFPVVKAKQRKAVILDGEARGQVLLYTGVRYHRLDGVWHDENHRPRRGGSRS